MGSSEVIGAPVCVHVCAHAQMFDPQQVHTKATMTKAEHLETYIHL